MKSLKIKILYRFYRFKDFIENLFFKLHTECSLTDKEWFEKDKLKSTYSKDSRNLTLTKEQTKVNLNPENKIVMFWEENFKNEGEKEFFTTSNM